MIKMRCKKLIRWRSQVNEELKEKKVKSQKKKNLKKK